MQPAGSRLLLGAAKRWAAPTPPGAPLAAVTAPPLSARQAYRRAAATKPGGSAGDDAGAPVGDAGKQPPPASGETPTSSASSQAAERGNPAAGKNASEREGSSVDEACQTKAGKERSIAPLVALAGVVVGGVGAAALYLQRQREEQEEAQRFMQMERARQRKEAEEARIAAEALAEAECQAAQERAELEARQASAAAHVRPLISELQAQLEAAADLSVVDVAVETMREALQEAQDLVKATADLVDGARESAVATLDAAEERLKTLDHASRTRNAHEEAQRRLQQFLIAKDADGCRDALNAMDNAEAVLVGLREKVPEDGGLAVDARRHLAELERLEREAARRAAAKDSLEAAVASKQSEACALALVEAREAGVDPCPAFELAAILAQPRPAYDELAKNTSSRIAEWCNRFGRDTSVDLTVEDYVAAETEAAALMDVDTLRDYVKDLSRAIVANHLFLTERLDLAMPQIQEELSTILSERAERALHAYSEDKTRATNARAEELKDTYAELTEEGVNKAVAQVNDEGSRYADGMRHQAAEVQTASVAFDRDMVNERLSLLDAPVSSLNDMAGNQNDPHRKASVSEALARALIDAEGAFGERQDLSAPSKSSSKASGADSFVSRLLALMPPEIAGQASLQVPPVQSLKDSFKSGIDEIVAMALTPRADGLISAMSAVAIGRVCSSLHTLRESANPPLGGRLSATSPEEHDILRTNLGALARASSLVEREQYEEALLELEARLTGACRTQAAGWMKEAREAILLRRAAQALEARARCLNASLR